MDARQPPAAAAPAASTPLGPQPPEPARPDAAEAGKALEASLEAIAVQGKALLTLAGRELGLGAALLGRALVLSLIGFAAGLLTVGLGAALLVALGLAIGLGWPGALAAATALMLGVALLCRAWAGTLLAEARLPATRRQLGALLRQRHSAAVQERPA